MARGARRVLPVMQASSAKMRAVQVLHQGGRELGDQGITAALAQDRRCRFTAGSRGAPTTFPSANGWESLAIPRSRQFELTLAGRAGDGELIQSQQVMLRSMNIGRNTRDHGIASDDGRLQRGNATGSLRDPAGGESLR